MEWVRPTHLFTEVNRWQTGRRTKLAAIREDSSTTFRSMSL